MELLDRLLGRRRRVAIARAVEGTRVRIGGKVSCARPLIAPYTGRSCAYWRLELLQQLADSTTTGTALEATSFVVDDGSARAEILIEGCTFDIVANYVEMERASSLSRKAHALAAKHGWAPLADIAQINVREAILAIDEDVEIEGTPVRDADADVHAPGERGYRDMTATKLVFSRDTRVRGSQRESVFIKP